MLSPAITLSSPFINVSRSFLQLLPSSLPSSSSLPVLCRAGEILRVFQRELMRSGAARGCPRAGAADSSYPSLLSVLLPPPAPERGRRGYGATPGPQNQGEVVRDARDLAGTDLVPSVPRVRAGLVWSELEPRDEQGRVASLACPITWRAVRAVCCSSFGAVGGTTPGEMAFPFLPRPRGGGDQPGFVFRLLWAARGGSPCRTGRPKPTRNKATRQRSFPAPAGGGKKLHGKHRPRWGAQTPRGPAGPFPTLCFPSGLGELPPRGPSGGAAVPLLQMVGVFPWVSSSALTCPPPPGVLGCPQPCLCR